jgi:hypothetical protein
VHRNARTPPTHDAFPKVAEHCCTSIGNPEELRVEIASLVRVQVREKDVGKVKRYGDTLDGGLHAAGLLYFHADHEV